jgi:PPOX class probable F420-dependent enzyme
VIDESTEFGARVARHLREETFLWDGGENVSVYSQRGARIRNIGRNPKVTLNFRDDANGGDIVVLSGRAEVDESGPSAAEDAAWMAKYAAEWERVGMTAESFTERFNVSVRRFASAPSTDSEHCPARKGRLVAGRIDNGTVWTSQRGSLRRRRWR